MKYRYFPNYFFVILHPIRHANEVLSSRCTNEHDRNEHNVPCPITESVGNKLRIFAVTPCETWFFLARFWKYTFENRSDRICGEEMPTLKN